MTSSVAFYSFVSFAEWWMTRRSEPGSDENWINRLLFFYLRAKSILVWLQNVFLISLTFFDGQSFGSRGLRDPTRNRAWRRVEQPLSWFSDNWKISDSGLCTLFLGSLWVSYIFFQTIPDPHLYKAWMGQICAVWDKEKVKKGTDYTHLICTKWANENAPNRTIWQISCRA